MSARRPGFTFFLLSAVALTLLSAGWLCPPPAAANGLERLDTRCG